MFCFEVFLLEDSFTYYEHLIWYYKILVNNKFTARE